jgi:predicted TIM-barrel fold metal-dependent hydrolase
MSIVDIHPHIICTDMARHPLNPLGGSQSTWSRDRPVPYEKMIEEMNAAGVDKSALVQAATAYGFDNSYVAEAIAAYPKRFTGVFTIDVMAPDAVDKMKYWLDRGFSGMRLFTTGSTMPDQATWFDDARTYPAWEYAGRVGIPVCMQMTPSGFLQLRGLMERFPQVKMILDHLAKPEIADGPPYAAAAGLFALADYKNLFMKVTPRNLAPPDWGKATPATFFAKLVGAFGARRIAWGSNFPANKGPLSMLLAQSQQSLASLNDDDRAWILGKTAQSLYPPLAD